MNNRIDRLFKNKLGDHRLPPSQEAWTKIESGLSKKNNTVILWRAAAVFVLCGFLTGAWFYWQSQGHSQQIATQKDDTIDNLPGTQEPLAEPMENEENRNQVAVIAKSEHIKRKKIATNNNEEVILPTEIMKEAETELTPVFETVSTELVAKAEKPIVIEFTLDPVPSTTLVAKATEEEKGNGFKKILDKALDLKNGEGDLGGLRDAKNELFALDFKKDKTKRN
jgi:hypothetical protein